jgi:hypothetical protein
LKTKVSAIFDRKLLGCDKRPDIRVFRADYDEKKEREEGM